LSKRPSMTKKTTVKEFLQSLTDRQLDGLCRFCGMPEAEIQATRFKPDSHPRSVAVNWPARCKMGRAQKERTLQSETEMTIVLSAVAECFGLSMAELRESTRSRAVVLPRQIAMYLAKQMTAASLQEIGREFGGKHHTTVMHSIAKIDEQCRVNKDLKRVVGKLLEKLRADRNLVPDGPLSSLVTRHRAE
jgi:Bacterial dnaA protein helix-turn-helix